MRAYRARHNRPEPDDPQPELSFDDPASDDAFADSDAAESLHGAVAPQRDAEVTAREVIASESRLETPQREPIERTTHNRVPPRSAASGASFPAVNDFVAPPPALPRRPDPPPPRDRPKLEHLEIDVAQPAFDFDAADGQSYAKRSEPELSWSDSAVFTVAPLARRRKAALLDAALLLFSYGAFLSVFAALGGRFAFSKLDVAVVGATLAVFYALYVALFTFFGGTTPGMMLRHLRVVGFDGSEPTPAQLVWRSFGYLVSAGTLMFGFLSALWDDDGLCWHDRISQTYLTSTDESPRSEADSR